MTPGPTLVILVAEYRYYEWTAHKKEMAMNVGRLVGGLICLAIAALLAILNSTLPENELMFMVGDQNMPLLPVAILGVVGVILLATVGLGKQDRADAAAAAPAAPPDEAKIALNKRLEAIGWGCFLIMLGGFSFVPARIVPKGLWSIGIGLIMLGLNGARYAYGIRMSGFTTVLGILSLVSGATQLMGLNSIEGPVLLIILGAYLIVKPWIEKRQLFGEAEQS
jgi:uncharacterized integral membrane protein